MTTRVNQTLAGFSPHMAAPTKFRLLMELANDLEATNRELLAALEAVCACYRTFRNVPKDEQEWTATDDEALAAGFAAIDKAKGEA